ncbi:TonB-dependent receptor [Pseudomonadales bacterium]|nr:TonB-dependent receptor [Pseudomonadales bacterium]
MIFQNKWAKITGTVILATVALGTQTVHAEGRVIEEVLVTAEKRQSTVSDTSISISAFGQSQLENFGIQGADELVNFIPATTRDTYDIRIRGVGRNFRALGGDPGVATYYNGIYSEDFGIASSENGLYDVARVEVLRGPQGTLYGRNSIGGALNYITNKPTNEFEGEFRVAAGNLGSQEYYGVLSGPLVKDKLAYRLVGIKRDRDGSIDGQNGSQDINTIDDQNISLALEWNIAENWQMNVRWNDRDSDRIIGQQVPVADGTEGQRGTRDTTNFARGLRPTSGTTSGEFIFTHPTTGALLYGLPVRPGVDRAASNAPNPAFGATGLTLNRNLFDLDNTVATNNENDEEFVQQGVQFDLNWDISDTVSLKYLGGWQDFDYTFDIEYDYTDAEFSQARQTVLEAVETSSHELQLLWQIGERLEITSGLYLFNSDRRQNFAFRDNTRFVNPFNYGNLAGFAAASGANPAHQRLGDTGGFGLWQGDPGAASYEYFNDVVTKALAAYTQGTYTFNDNWALTVGVRWAKDEKAASENRTGYFEANLDAGPFAGLGPALDGQCDLSFNTDCSALGLTPLAIANIFTGAATPTFNPANPITPTCALGSSNCATPLLLQGIPFSFADQAADEDDWGDVSFRVNLDWTPSEDTLIYGSVTTGYRSGGYSLGIGDSRAVGNLLTYEQEEVVAYELGYKGTLLDGKLQVNASAYTYDYSDYQDRIEIFNNQTATALDQVINADSAINSGLEVEVIWLASDSLSIGGNASYTKAEYDSDLFVLEDDNPAYPTSIFGNFNLDPNNPGTDNFLVRNYNGNALKRIPEWKATIWTSYEWQFSDSSLTAGAVYAFTGSYYSSGIERTLDEVPERLRIDLSLIWRDSAENWTEKGFVDNVTGQVYARGLDTPTEGRDFRLVAESLYPRYYGVDVTYRFGAR